MRPQPQGLTSSGLPTQSIGPAQSDHPREFERLWRGFMTARVTLGLVLVLLQAAFHYLSPPQSTTPLLICVAYFCAALTVRVIAHPQQLGHTFDAQWLPTVGVDVVAYAALQVLQISAINYTPLFALPVLMASILGSMMLAMGAAAGVTLMLFVYAGWQSLGTQGDISALFLQAALTGAGCFAISFIANQLAKRLASMELQAQRSQLAATVQRQVNERVIESLGDGILVADESGQVRSANPAALQLLGTQRRVQDAALNLAMRPGWKPLLDTISSSFAAQAGQQTDLNIRHVGFGSRRLRVRTQLTEALGSEAMGLCVVFMQDQREVQARIRSEKLAGMGRVSAAVAHEIRNPLAAISQANALLTEDLSDPGQQRLARIVQQNAQRLEKTVRDVLHLAQAPGLDSHEPTQLPDLTEVVHRVCRDWKNQHAVDHELLLNLPAESSPAWFDQEHLRRVVINLLDNAHRYASHQVASIQVSLDLSRAPAPHCEAVLRIWSDGEPLDPSVEQHLFEPFFSSESRSSGLGLYICRELCESHGASISYERYPRPARDQTIQGNEFSVVLKTHPVFSESQAGKLGD